MSFYIKAFSYTWIMLGRFKNPCKEISVTTEAWYIKHSSLKSKQDQRQAKQKNSKTRDIDTNSSAVNRLKYLIAINRMISMVNLPFIANWSHLFKWSVLNVPLRDIFQVFNTFIIIKVKKDMLALCKGLLLFQQSKSRDTTVTYVWLSTVCSESSVTYLQISHVFLCTLVICFLCKLAMRCMLTADRNAEMPVRDHHYWMGVIIMVVSKQTIIII